MNAFEESAPPTTQTASLVRKFTARVEPGQRSYRIRHGLGTEDVIIQTRIAGRIRDGGLSIVDANTVALEFGGALNEAVDVVIIG